jgi:putative peptidoglycan lipid II flippase
MSGKSNSFSKSVSGFALAGLITKALGYVRDAMLVAYFGGGALSDAYYAALRLVNVFRRTIGEGAINAAFIPLLEKERARSEEDAKKFFTSVWTLLICASAVLAFGAILLRRPLVSVLTGGFATAREQFELTALLTAIFMPHLVFVNASALLQAAMNAARSFFAPALAGAAFSLALIFCLIFLRCGGAAGLSPAGQITLVTAVASLSGLLQAGLLARMAAKEGYPLGPTASLSAAKEGMKALALALPAAAALAQDQLSMLINTVYASYLEPGSITAVYNAGRIAQFPVSLFAASAAAVSLPEISRAAAGGGRDTAAMEQAFKTTALIMLPAAAGLALLSLPITRALFEHGLFTYADSVITADAIFFLSLGLPAFGANKVAVCALYGAGKDSLPAKTVFFQLLANALLALPLMNSMGLSGLMLATSLSSWGAAFYLIYRLKKDTAFSVLDGCSLIKIVAATAAMGAVVLAFRAWFETALTPVPLTALCVSAGLAVYFAALRLLGCQDRKLVTGGLF